VSEDAYDAAQEIYITKASPYEKSSCEEEHAEEDRSAQGDRAQSDSKEAFAVRVAHRLEHEGVHGDERRTDGFYYRYAFRRGRREALGQPEQETAGLPE
jgi:hypothetical protein